MSIISQSKNAKMPPSVSALNLNKADTDGGIEEVLKNTLQIQNDCDHSEVLEAKPLLVGGGTDGTSVNLAQHTTSIRSKLQNSLPWLYWSR